MSCLTNFHPIRPRYEIDQKTILDWIAMTHARASESSENHDYETVYRQISEKFDRLWGNSRAIEKKGVHIHDLFEQDAQKRELYPITHPNGKGFTERSRFFNREATALMKAFYEGETPLPDHLIHVTCTGYVAPSPAQQVVAWKKAGEKTTVTHAYHMGCYGAFAAIRMGKGFLSSKNSVDIVHTELSSLHMHPLNHSTAQLLVESLFADGFIKYSLRDETDRPHFKVLGLLEEIIPESAESMTWSCENYGLGMTLSKEVPVLIARHLEGYLHRLCQIAQVDCDLIQKKALFAVHPGGPKILHYVEQILSLNPLQIEHSKAILRDCGNMSSATLPHIWERVLKDPKIPDQTYILSLAFGPGLSISGGIFQKNLPENR